MATNAIWNFYTAGQLMFGAGAAKQIGEQAVRRKLKRVFIVTDANLEAAGIVDFIRGPLLRSGLAVETFNGGRAEPEISIAIEAAEHARAMQPDAIIGLGGGSNMDLAKIASVLLTHGGQPADYFGFDNVPGPVLPLICVPTTSGTGSEVSHAAVLTDTDNAMKVSTLSNYLRPALALVDPVLTYDCPQQIAADSGIDALTHAIEAYTATDFDCLDVPDGQSCAYEGSFALGDCIAEKAIQLVGENLVNAVCDPKNRRARDGMSLAATLAGIAFSNCGVALVHALEYPLGGSLHCSHGAGNGLLLPFVMRFNMPVRTAKFARVAQLLNCDVSNKSEADAAEAAISRVEQLKIEIGIPERIRDLGGDLDQLPEFARKSFSISRLRWINPRQSTENDLLGILESAF